jgi:N-acetylglucosaminyl-diphospho-decaprenol L-rhamnosyltransferase
VTRAVRLTVGILTYNSERMLPDLLASLPAGMAGVDDWQLVIADGASTDGTVEVARRLAPGAAVAGLGANRGFAAAANAVISFDPSTDAVLILSPTVRLSPGCARPMLAALGRPGAGIAVPRLFRGTGMAYPSLRRRPTLLRAWSEALLGGRLARRIGALSEIIAGPEGYTSQTRADWATGAVTMVSRECLRQAGDWDETFFLYSEETEFELRARDAGFGVTFVDVNVTHLGGEARARPDLYALQCANRVRLYAMRHHAAAAGMFWAAIAVGEALRALPRRTPLHQAAVRKLRRERRALISGRPARV